ncbi:REP element-mobilizing transposase RayT [Pullulanibacillus pueri]|uniref:Transposase IS200-like domain-containing protein n=1 Tax=Pullulanibacillus pueri TaxID=1437324 RepID=A0A8J2ZT50_9BACL|nr:transposase [Pullulanibacillus pueri]MBM7680249.1 REP element-mobilizing transposase RayT [Pullulanibacillus pueri]GGH76020.1 hypothetical protein GCM10007096_05840 [Pullulanibacillus pueri]
MPRKPRRKSRNGIYHIVLRGVNKQTIFEDDEDKIRFLDTVRRYKKTCKYFLYGYCLMDNHVHLLLKETNESVSKVIQRLSASYVYWYNHKYERYGHLFQERFKSENVETARYFLTVLRYIHQNPIKAGLSTNVFDCGWTSINEYMSKADLVDIDLGLKLFALDQREALKRFIDFMSLLNDDTCLEAHVKTKVSDTEVKNILNTLGITNMSVLQQLEKAKRDVLLRRLKGLNGVSIRQLSRITGLSKSVIDRAR